VDLGHEAPKVDLKVTLDLSTKPNRAEFVKDVTAIANTPGGTGYLILGVWDNRKRPRVTYKKPEDYVPGFAPEDPDAFEREIIDALSHYCNRVPEVRFSQVMHPQTQRLIGVVIISRSSDKPHELIRSGERIEAPVVFVRRGTATYKATAEEIASMDREREVGPLSEVIVVNLSGHPLTDSQREELGAKYRVYVEELIELPVHFDPQQDLKSQAREYVHRIGLAPEEWSERQVHVILPGLAPGAAAILATIHGLSGGFPKVLWIYQAPHDRTRYELAQVVDLQECRDLAREVRVSVLGEPL